jgi:hypothetical protein
VIWRVFLLQIVDGSGGEVFHHKLAADKAPNLKIWRFNLKSRAFEM